ncbi:MAG: sialate O-acetylesterase [Halanaerobiaceae bacterium]
MKIDSKNNKELKLPQLISNGMVLQRGKNTWIWGWAVPEAKVKISFIDRLYITHADKSGNWMIRLSNLKAGGPYDMTVESEGFAITVYDILIGEVWLCSGQSNMQLTMERAKDIYKEEIKNCSNNMIRNFTVPIRYDFNEARQDLDSGEWNAVSPDTIIGFSATAYFFAKKLYESYQVPVGIINASVGGSPIEAWLSEEALEDYPEYLERLNKYRDKSYIDRVLQKDRQKIDKWFDKLNESDEGLEDPDDPWYNYAHNTSNWEQIHIPGYFSQVGLDDFKGVIWLRKEIEIPASVKGKAGRLLLGRIVDSDKAYINGEFVGKVEYKYPPRKYDIPVNLLKEGKNSIVLRVVVNNGRGGFIKDKPYKLIVGDETIDLKGEWQYKVGAEVSESLPEETFIQWEPVGLFNGMISPLLNYTIRGINWYQGESNIARPEEYRRLFPLLIDDWRKKWHLGQLPFLYVQLPNYGLDQKESVESDWAVFREVQFQSMNIPNTAMIVTIDVGEWNDLHPLNKKDVGYRLALAARYKAYDDKIVYSGPLYKSMKIQDNKIIVKFENVGSGLEARGSDKPAGFSIAGEDGKYLPADTQIIGKNSVAVYNDEVTNPVSVRYAWADNPEDANLYNKEGLPASPFRSKEK